MEKKRKAITEIAENDLAEFKGQMYGVRRNCRGQREYRYIYDEETLRALEKIPHATGLQHSPAACDSVETTPSLDGYESSFASNDTYTFKRLDTDEDIVQFIFDVKDCCGVENPSLEFLRDFESILDTTCMYTGRENPTVIGLIRKWHVPEELLSLKDCRYYELLRAGMTEEEMYGDWNTEISVKTLLEALSNGTYRSLKERYLPPRISVDTNLGKITAYACEDIDNPAIAVMFTPKGEDFAIDLCLAEVPCEECRIGVEEPHIAILEWENPFDEDYTHKAVITESDLKECFPNISLEDMKVKDILTEEVINCIDNGTIRVFQEPNEDFAKCEIGSYWFYFTHIEEECCLEDFATDELAEMITKCINNAEENGLGDAESEYYKAVIRESLDRREK